MLNKKKWILLPVISVLLLVCACGQQGKKDVGKTYKIYYVNRDETGVISNEYVTETTDRDELLGELLQQMETGSEKLEYKAPISGTFQLLGTTFSEDQLILNFDENYRLQPVISEILVRAAIVRTLTQIDGVSYLSFQVNAEPLLDASGALVGVMNADQFIDNAGNEINTYEKVKLTLYLADEEGDGLKAVTRTVVYNSNISMERLVVDQLIAGPDENEAAFPTINPDTRVVSVNVQDGICYVNLDSTFLTQIYNVTSEVTIYSITNSLVELTNVNKVQISIDGDSNVNYKENISLSTVFERNLEIVE
ncbi:MAG: GerMN domain-containing protein [Lachnospiraceae bacterium]|nr:GerMN domain-containing protein [Lachnospiraceae bacterium]